MSCGELFDQFAEILSEDDVDFRLFRRLLAKCRRWALKAVGPEYEALRAFLERGEAVVEVGGRKKAIVRKKSSIAVVDLDSLNFEKTKRN